MSKKIGSWGGSCAIRLGAECKDLEIEVGDKVHTIVKDGKIIIEKINEEFKVVNGVKFITK